MATGGWVDPMSEPAEISVDRAAIDSRLLRLRAEKFRSLATLLGTDVPEYGEAIAKLMEPCPGIRDCPARNAGADAASLKAMEWAQSVADPEEMAEEHRALFGSSDLVTAMPQIPPSAAMYGGVESAEMVEGMRALYDSMGFREGSDDRLTHIDIELRFAGFVLGLTKGLINEDD